MLQRTSHIAACNVGKCRCATQIARLVESGKCPPRVGALSLSLSAAARAARSLSRARSAEILLMLLMCCCCCCRCYGSAATASLLLLLLLRCCCCEGLQCFWGCAVGPWAIARSVVVACCRWPGLLSSVWTAPPPTTTAAAAAAAAAAASACNLQHSHHGNRSRRVAFSPRPTA